MFNPRRVRRTESSVIGRKKVSLSWQKRYGAAGYQYDAGDGHLRAVIRRPTNVAELERAVNALERQHESPS